MLLVLASACSTVKPAPTGDANAPIVERYPVSGGGEITMTVLRAYPAGQPVDVQLEVVAGTVAIRGPLMGRVLSSGIEGEKTIRTLPASTLDGARVDPGARRSLTVTWDGRTDAGDAAPRDTYTLTLDLVVGEQPVRVGTTVELAGP